MKAVLSATLRQFFHPVGQCGQSAVHSAGVTDECLWRLLLLQGQTPGRLQTAHLLARPSQLHADHPLLLPLREGRVCSATSLLTQVITIV